MSDGSLPIVVKQTTGVAGVRVERPVKLNKRIFLIDPHSVPNEDKNISLINAKIRIITHIICHALVSDPVDEPIVPFRITSSRLGHASPFTDHHRIT